VPLSLGHTNRTPRPFAPFDQFTVSAPKERPDATTTFGVAVTAHFFRLARCTFNFNFAACFSPALEDHHRAQVGPPRLAATRSGHARQKTRWGILFIRIRLSKSRPESHLSGPRAPLGLTAGWWGGV